MNIQTLFLIVACLFIASLIMGIIIRKSKQSAIVQATQYVILVIINLVILISIFYLPNLPSFFGGGAIKEYPYEKVLEQPVVVPELKAKNVIKYKNEGLKELNNSLKNKNEVK